jgi:hypothetical protein
MALNKVTAAKISAYQNGWVDPEEFAKHAKEGTVYIQANRHYPQSPVSFFALGKEIKPEIPMKKLASSFSLSLAVPINALDSKMLSKLWEIETQWEKQHSGVSQSIEEGFFEVAVVADVGKDTSTGEIGYACIEFPDMSYLEAAIKREPKNQKGQVYLEPRSLSDTEIKSLKNFFLGFYADGRSKWTTLKQVNKAIPKIKKRQETKLRPEEIFIKKKFEELSGEQR